MPAEEPRMQYPAPSIPATDTLIIDDLRTKLMEATELIDDLRATIAGCRNWARQLPWEEIHNGLLDMAGPLNIESAGILKTLLGLSDAETRHEITDEWLVTVTVEVPMIKVTHPRDWTQQQIDDAATTAAHRIACQGNLIAATVLKPDIPF